MQFATGLQPTPPCMKLAEPVSFFVELLQARWVVGQYQIKDLGWGCYSYISVVSVGNLQLLDDFRALTEYECGRAQMAVEWAPRAQKPVVEIGGRPVVACDLLALASDLDRCIDASGEEGLALIIPDKTRGYCCYGFYCYPWSIKASLPAWGGKRATDMTDRSLWEQGLVFGYNDDAIQRFISSASSSQESSSSSGQCNEFYHHRKVGIYGSLVSRVRLGNSRAGRRQSHQPH